MVESMQISNTMTFSRHVARIKEDSHGIRSSLAASNDNFWLLASGPSISREKMKGTMKWRTCVRRRLQPCSVKGKYICSGRRYSKIEAEMDLLSFQLSLEGRKGKKSIKNKINELISDDNAHPEVGASAESESEDLSDLTPNFTTSLLLVFSRNPNSSAASSIILIIFEIRSDEKSQKNVSEQERR